jgi:hypothetical protein
VGVSLAPKRRRSRSPGRRPHRSASR